MGTKVHAVSVSPEVLYCHYPSPPHPHHPLHVLLSLAIGGLVLLQVLPLLMRAAFHYTTTNAAAPICTALPPHHTAPIYTVLFPYCSYLYCTAPTLPPNCTAPILYCPSLWPSTTLCQSSRRNKVWGFVWILFPLSSPYNISSSLSISIKIVLPITLYDVHCCFRVQAKKYNRWNTWSWGKGRLLLEDNRGVKAAAVDCLFSAQHTV